MITDMRVESKDMEKNRKDLKPFWVSSVMASVSGLNTQKFRELCMRSEFRALRVDIAGTVKYYFDRGQFEDMIKATGQEVNDRGHWRGRRKNSQSNPS